MKEKKNTVLQACGVLVSFRICLINKMLFPYAITIVNSFFTEILFLYRQKRSEPDFTTHALQNITNPKIGKHT